jgi:thiopurine S-methyltransferase
MDRDFWLNRWQENRIGFHLAEVNPLLKRFHDETAPGRGRALAPLCGKSLDLRWLADRGHDVSGVELSLIAARTFMAEQGLDPVTTEEPPFTVFRAGRIELYAGNFFEFSAERFGQFDLIYDRAALIALSPETRPAYARQLRSLLKPAGRILLISLEYDRGAMAGPPFTVPEAEARRLFEGMTMDKLLEYDCLENEPHFKERGLRWMKESVYRIHST